MVFWVDWLLLLFSFTIYFSLLPCFLMTACDKGTFEWKVSDTDSAHWAFSSSLLCFLITACDKGTFGEGCRSRCHCLNGVGCNNVNGQCPHGDCDTGWKTRTCSEGKVFLLSYWTLCLISVIVNRLEIEHTYI